MKYPYKLTDGKEGGGREGGGVNGIYVARHLHHFMCHS